MFYPISLGFQFYVVQYITKSNSYVEIKYQVSLGMNEWKKLDPYEMVKPKNKIGLF
jgi:hypothetical protein